MAQGLGSLLPSTCRWLGPENVDLVGEHPIAAGEFTNIYEATHDGRKVILKSYRPYVSFDVAQVVTRFRNEVHVCTLLHHEDVDVVPLVGVYSTEAHPFGLVYEYMHGLDLRHYMRNEPSAEKLKLLQLARIARCLNRMHDLGIVHGHLQSTNILVNSDGTAQIAGLGNASILPHSILAGTVESNARSDRLSRAHAPELICPRALPNLTEPTRPTKASDMYAFGVMAWEVLTGRPPFFDMTEIAATYSMLNGARPTRPNHHEMSDRLWYLIERCWHGVPSERMPAGEAVDLLETELGRTS